MMRLMLGTLDRPTLLVEVIQQAAPQKFDFEVINGNWPGAYTNGYITVWHPDAAFTHLDKIEILTDNQDRLRGAYQTVFDNWNNPDYIAPVFKIPHSWNDDIAF